MVSKMNQKTSMSTNKTDNIDIITKQSLSKMISKDMGSSITEA